jgi:hypothetical protein
MTERRRQPDGVIVSRLRLGLIGPVAATKMYPACATAMNWLAFAIGSTRTSTWSFSTAPATSKSGELAWQHLGHLKTKEVGEVLERTVRRIEKHLRRRGLLDAAGDVAEPEDKGRNRITERPSSRSDAWLRLAHAPLPPAGASP